MCAHQLLIILKIGGCPQQPLTVAGAAGDEPRHGSDPGLHILDLLEHSLGAQAVVILQKKWRQAEGRG
jgi:hypothetical protein